MGFNIRSILKRKNLIILLKFAVVFFAVFFLLNTFMLDGLKVYLNSKDLNVENTLKSENVVGVRLDGDIKQGFVSQGDVLNRISLMITGSAPEGSIMNLKVVDSKGNNVSDQRVDLSEMTSDSLNSFNVNIKNLKRNEHYTLRLSSNCDSAIVLIDDFNDSARNCFSNVVIGNSEEPKALVVGMQFTYKYVTLADIMYAVLRGIILITLLMVFIYGVISFEKYYAVFVNSNNYRAGAFALFFAFVVILQANPMNKLSTNVSSFTREIGGGFIQGYDVTKAIGNFTGWFVLFALFFCIFYLVANYWLNLEKNDDEAKFERYFKDFMVIANINLLLRAITFFYDKSISDKVFYYSSYEILLIAVCAIFFIVFKMGKRGVSADQYLKSFIVSFAGSFVVCALLGTEWESGRLTLGVQTLLFVFTVVISMLYKKIKRKPLSDIYVIGVSVFPLFCFLYIESVNVLNQYGVFVTNLGFNLFVISALWIAVLFTMTKVKRFDRIKLPDWKSISYPLLVFGISALSVQIPLQGVFGADLFESSNRGLPISDFFYFGKIPIVENLGHHMMSEVWEGIVYAVFNNDVAGSIFTPYANFYIPFVSVLFFYVVKQIWNEEAALATTLFFPFLVFWWYIGWGSLIVLCAVNYVKKNSYKNAVILWMALVWCALYRVDLGYSFGIACIMSLALYVLLEKNVKVLKELSISFLGVCTFFAVLWFALCVIKSVNPVTRLIEFLKLFAAAISWSYNGIGDPGNTVYFWGYFVIPFFILIALLYSVFIKKFRQEIGYEKWMMLMIFGLTYFANYSRAMQRHSLAEMFLIIVIFTGYAFISLFIALISKKKYLFVPMFAILIVVNTLFQQDTNFTFTTIAEDAVAKEASNAETWTLSRFAGGSETPVWDGNDGSDGVIEAREYVYKDGEDERTFTYWDILAKNGRPVNRVIYSDDLKNQIEPFSDIINGLLDKNETFVDFICSGFLYSVFQKESPVYIAQSPTMLSGEYTQELFVQEIEENKGITPIILMPNGSGYCEDMDGVRLTYKYYKVAEYIYDNYVPLCTSRFFSIWCRPNRYEEYKNKLAKDYRINFVDAMLEEENFDANNINIVKDLRSKKITLEAIGGDPFLADVQQYVDLSGYAEMTVDLKVDYTSTVPGIVQIFYTTDEGEEYSEEKSFVADIGESGEFSFSIPVTTNTRWRFDIPEESNFTINSIYIEQYPLIDYDYAPDMHNTSIDRLALYWSEFDIHKAIKNEVLADAVLSGAYFRIKDVREIDKSDGNYLHIRTTYDGRDEYVPATVVLGSFEGEEFAERARFNFTLQKGTHDYLIRISSDYYWFLNEIDSIRIESEGGLSETSMNILKGD